MKQGAALPLGDALALEQEAHRGWAQRAELGSIQARTGSVMANNRDHVRLPSDGAPADGTTSAAGAVHSGGSQA